MVGEARTRTFAATAVLIAALVASLVAAPPSAFAAVALGGAVLAAAAPRTVRRLDVIALAAVWGLIAVMFGLSGAGCFILAHMIVLAFARLIQCVFRPSLALLVTCAAAACGAPILEVALGDRWPIAGPLLALLSLGAPGLILAPVASALRGRNRAAEERLFALAPQLVAIAIGAGLDGLNGASAALAMGMLATPLLLLLAAGPRASLRFSIAAHALGVLAAGLVACVATALALRFAHAHLAAMGPAVGIGLIAGFAALRVHAPAALERLRVVRPSMATGSTGVAAPARR